MELTRHYVYLLNKCGADAPNLIFTKPINCWKEDEHRNTYSIMKCH